MVKLKKGTLPQRLSLATAPATANAESVEKIKDNNDERENEDVTNNWR